MTNSKVHDEFHKISLQVKELAVFEEHFKAIKSSIHSAEMSQDLLDGMKALLESETWRGNTWQISDFDMAQSILFLINRIEIKADDN